MRAFRTFLFWTHLSIALLAALIILLMSVTGVLLTYERQMIAWSDAEFRSQVPAAEPSRLPIATVIERARASEAALREPGVSVLVAAEADAPVRLSVGPRRFYADAYSGQVLGEGGAGMRSFMSGLRDWHRWLAMSDGRSFAIARAITGWSNVIFAVLILSGLYLWMPKRWTWKHLRPVTLFAWRHQTGKARDFNWHNVIGLWTAIPLFIVVVSAVPISFPWGNALVYTIFGETPPAGRGSGGPAARAGDEDPAARQAARVAALDAIDARLATASQRVAGWRTISFRLPESPSDPVAFSLDRGDGGQPQLRSTLTLLAGSGEEVEYQAFGDLSRGRRLRSITRFAHTGEVLGIPGQTIAGIVSFGGIILVWTGVALAWRRFRAWIARRAAQPAMSRSSAA